MHSAEVVNRTVLPGFLLIVRSETTDALLPAFALSHLHEVQHSRYHFVLTQRVISVLQMRY